MCSIVVAAIYRQWKWSLLRPDEKCTFTTLKYRRLRGDMIEVFKIIKHKYDHKVAPELLYSTNNITRRNKSSATAELARDADDVDFSVEDVYT